MIAFTAQMREHINTAFARRNPCVLATASKDGRPGIGFRGTMLVYDDDHLAYWDRGSGNAPDHVAVNPHVAVSYADFAARVAWRFYGDAHKVTDPAVREDIYRRTPEGEQRNDPEKKGSAYLIRVDLILDTRGRVLQQRDG